MSEQKSPCTDGEVAEIVALLGEHIRYQHMPALARQTMEGAADLIARLSADRARWHKAAMDAGVVVCANGSLIFASRERAERAEAERDDARIERDIWKRDATDLELKLQRAEAELSALKARVAEVLEPFAKANDQWLAIVSPDLPDGHELNVMGSTVGHFRRASELHATLSGERK